MTNVPDIPIEPAAGGPPWVVVATMTPWEEVPRIRHQIARGLARYYRVLYITFPTSWQDKYRSEISSPEVGIVVWRPSNWFTVPGRVVAGLPAARLPEQCYLSSAFDRQLRSLDSEPRFVINFDHRNNWIQQRRWFPRSVYLCNDDHSLPFARSKPQPQLAALTRRQMREAARRADLCLVTSEHYRQVLEMDDRAQVFLPGHDLPATTPSLGQSGDSTRPIRVGYMGYISRRLNRDWVQHAAQQSDIEFHAIGPVVDQEVYNGLKKHHVQLESPLTGRALLDWLVQMDVLTIPYDISRDEALGLTAPNKIFAYLAAGKPVVVSELPSLREWCTNTIYRAEDRESFLRQIRRARDDDNVAYAGQRLDVARQHTWEKQIETLLGLIEPRSYVSKQVQYSTCTDSDTTQQHSHELSR